MVRDTKPWMISSLFPKVILLSKMLSYPSLYALSYSILLLAKEKISVTVDGQLLKWVDSQIKKKKFASRSHAIEFALSSITEK